VAIRLTDPLNRQGDYAALDDRLLVLDFQSGNPEAFVEIHRRHRTLVRTVCRRFLINEQDVDEAFQETMIRVFQGLHRFNGQYALRPWISRIATNVSLDQIRARARRPQQESDLEAHDHEDDAEGPEALVERLVERDRVLAVLTELPAHHRTSLVLRELEGRSHVEIADAMGITPGQAKALIHRAKLTFRRRWLLRLAEGGGAAGFVLLPVRWLLRADATRRLIDRAAHTAELAQAGAAEHVAAAASSGAPAVATGVAERVVTAGMTLLLAGGVTVGAATMHDHLRPEPRRWSSVHQIAATVPAVVEVPAQRATSAMSPEDGPPVGHHASSVPAPHPAAAAPAAPAPVAEPTPATTPPPAPTEAPSPDPVVVPTEAPPSPDPVPTDGPTAEPTTESPTPDPVVSDPPPVDASSPPPAPAAPGV
jgi:RNA polymerase sigma-70 factor (ECF subfamily)